MKQAKKKRKASDGISHLDYRILNEREIINGKIITVEI